MERMPSACACAALLRVLADPTRLDVVRRLLDGPLHVGALNSGLGINQSLLSHHLRVLRDAGLVEAQRDGKSVLYRVTPGRAATGGKQGLDFGCCRVTFD